MEPSLRSGLVAEDVTDGVPNPLPLTRVLFARADTRAAEAVCAVSEEFLRSFRVVLG